MHSEMCKLQGMVPTNIGDYMKLVKSINIFNGAIGNAMSANVLERLLPSVAYACGLLEKRIADSWSDPDFVKSGGRFS